MNSAIKDIIVAIASAAVLPLIGWAWHLQNKADATDRQAKACWKYDIWLHKTMYDLHERPRMAFPDSSHIWDEDK